jgi:peptidoglycan/xylan/chitin deacetylase (PgdA/CDA1 family)
MLPELFVTFHGIGPPPNHVSADERLYWVPEVQFRKFIRGAKEAASSARIQIVATFDDGNRSDIDIAAPMLADCGLPGIFFPCSGRIGQRGYLTEDDLRTLDAKAFEIGSHGIRHVPWRGLGADALAQEIVQSKAAIERVLGHDITSAALPFGEYDSTTLRMLRKSGYRTVYSSDPGICPPSAWLRHRWSYRTDREFDIQSMARRSRAVSFRMVSESKRYVKSLR